MDQELIDEFQTLMQNAKNMEAQYELLEVIDTTNHSTIYKARTKEGAFRIVKQVNPSRENSNREFDILKSVHHEAIPQVYEIYQTVEGTYIVMEWVEGITLSDYVLGKERLTLKETIAIMDQLCEVVIYLHQMTLVHRDIKPKNIIINNNKVYLIDFDAARTFKADSTGDTTILGTAGYAPPEQYGFYQSNYQSDVYALGATFYYMLMGTNFSQEAVGALKQQKMKREVQKIIKKATAFNPDSRYETVDQLKNAVIGIGKIKVKPLIGLIIGLLLLIASVGYFTDNLGPLKGDQTREAVPQAVESNDSAELKDPSMPEDLSKEHVTVETSTLSDGLTPDEATPSEIQSDVQDLNLENGDYNLEAALNNEIPIQFYDKGMEKYIREFLDLKEEVYFRDLKSLKTISMIGERIIENPMDYSFIIGNPNLGIDYVSSYLLEDGSETKARGTIKTLDDLVYMPNVHSIDVVKHQLTNIDGLSHLKVLNHLNVTDNYIKDLTPLATHNISSLLISANLVEDIGVLEPIMNQLVNFFAEFNLIKDIRVIRNGINLSYLELSNNPIETEIPLDFSPALQGKEAQVYQGIF